MGAVREGADLPKSSLMTESAEIAMHASSAVGAIGEPAIKALIDSLAERNVAVKSFAVGSLGSIRNVRVVEPISRLLYDSDETVRNIAGGALVGLSRSLQRSDPFAPDQPVPSGPAAKTLAETDAMLRGLVIEQMKTAILSDNSAARLTAVKLAWELKSPDVCDALGQCLRANDPSLRAQAAQALSLINDPNSFPSLLVALRDENAKVRAVAANGLRYRIETYHVKNLHTELVDPLITALGDFNAHVRKSAAEALGCLDSVKKLPAHEKQATVDALIRRLDDEDISVVGAAIAALAILQDQKAVEPIFGLLQHEKLRVKAAVALARFRDPRALEPLRAALVLERPASDCSAWPVER